MDTPKFANLKAEMIAAQQSAEAISEELAAKRAIAEQSVAEIWQRFNQDNAELITCAQSEQSRAASAEAILRQSMSLYYQTTGEKQIDKTLGLSMRLTTKYRYDEQRAVQWAEIHAPIIVKKTIDKQAFEALCETPLVRPAFVEIEESLIPVISKSKN